jgi:hypothetical protein
VSQGCRSTASILVFDAESFAPTVRWLCLHRCVAVLAAPANAASINDIAVAHGFDRPTSFSRAFSAPPRDEPTPGPAAGVIGAVRELPGQCTLYSWNNHPPRMTLTA